MSFLFSSDKEKDTGSLTGGTPLSPAGSDGPVAGVWRRSLSTTSAGPQASLGCEKVTVLDLILIPTERTLGIAGVGCLYYGFTNGTFGAKMGPKEALQAIFGFSLGASSIALFALVISLLILFG